MQIYNAEDTTIKVPEITTETIEGFELEQERCFRTSASFTFGTMPTSPSIPINLQIFTPKNAIN